MAITVKVIAQMFFIGPIGTFQKSYLLNIITEKRSLTTAEPFNALKKFISLQNAQLNRIHFEMKYYT